jgi:hypothetical protein
MKLIIGLLFAASAAFAAMPDVSVVKQAADALSKTDPSLSGGLNEIAKRDTAAAQRSSQGQAIVPSRETQQKDIQTLNQGADKLESTQPDLSKGLRNYADEKTKMMNSREFQNMQRHRGYTP